MKKVLFVATVVKKHIMEFHVPYIRMLHDMGYQVDVAAKNDYDDPAKCMIPYCTEYFNIPFDRSPLSLANIEAYNQLKKIIDTGNYSFIHCHTPVGAALTRLAGQEARKHGTKIIYTAHGFHFYQGAPLINWLLYYPAEKYLAKYTDILITINKEDYFWAKNNFNIKNIKYVPGVGIDLRKFNNRNVSNIDLRNEIRVSDNAFILLSVGELIKRKNHQVVINAIALLKEKPIYSKLHYCICGSGPLRDHLEELCRKLNIIDHVHFLGYRSDIPDICRESNLFVFMSYQEGLPVALMEAMACGLPAICTRIRGNTDLISDRINGIFCENNAENLAEKIEYIYENTNLEDMRAKAVSSIQQFSLEHILKEVLTIYKNM